MQLQSYVQGRWFSGEGEAQQLRDATTGQVIAAASSSGIDFHATLRYAREVGGSALRKLTFHERASLLKQLAKKLGEYKDEFYQLSYATGATKTDSWIDIDGGFGTLFAYASRGSRELPNSKVYIDGDVEGLSKGGTFVGQHICVPLEGAAVHINAFNFPVWGMLEKLAPTLLAGVPAIVKPATTTAYLTERVVKRIAESGILPEGSLQLICGSVGDLFDHLNCQDVVSFTGSASTAQKLRTHPKVVANSVRFISETDSINSCVLGEDAKLGQPEFDLFVREVTREMTTKAGQKCTAIRKAIVPASHADAVVEALKASLAKVVVGDPRLENVRMGPLAALSQRREVLGRIAELRREAELITSEHIDLAGADSERGAFVAPSLLYCRDPRKAKALHHIEAFGPVATVVPYESTQEAITFARLGEGSLVASVFSHDDAIASELVLGLAPLHGRLLVINRDCAKESTGHGSPMPALVHGGPGRAGGGEEMGGIRGVMHYMQRTAIQGSPQTIAAVTGRWTRGAVQKDPGRHPFRKAFHELQIGDSLNSAEREVTLDDIEKFAALSGDTFYAHMDEEAAARNPLFGGRVAHGYFLVSAAAGLFVDPPYGPVLANYGIDKLRFVKPVKPGDRIKVRLTCKTKSLRADKGYGEVAWDTEITNQAGEVVASYDVLTMVSEQPVS
ncbi:phenylacetic acid degradation bifunctional protein PaaZ [Steroidobacter sp.]|uniref:phenylacetic acid degradation bifunctional protein PaaZ n=1 Tax=Steroidobacter sp. TaxID=1978227 RepID=UPI001A5C8498|nr:phenylacetic acid degradation bifunctional protein PaaZ [Steroidobacter sp.]MBL8269529.1 phenylacetic acid degradation bifunctional protein PaaZ [Steroidobacter sp.]